MADIHRQRRKDRSHRIPKIHFQPRSLILVELVVVFERNTRLRQRRTDFLFHDPAQRLHLALQLLTAELEFLARRPPVRRNPGVLAFDPAPQAADALHGEFVVQHSHDAGEFYSLQQWE